MTSAFPLEARRLGQAEGHDNIAARNQRLKDGDRIAVKVRRFQADEGLSFTQTFQVPYVRYMRVLDALIFITENEAPDLAFRWLCGSKMCGTCAVRMNGREVLACWESVEPEMVIEPLRNLPLVRDLVVDRSEYEERVCNLEPWIDRGEHAYAGFPEPLIHREIRYASRALDCISCLCCYSACPVVGLGQLTNFAGPAPLVQLAQTALDPRNSAGKVALQLEQTGVFNCVSCYKCEETCPARIPIVTHVIEPLKRRAIELAPAQARHALAFHAVLRARGRIDPSALMFRINGLRVLANLKRVARLLIRGKINPLRTLFPLPNVASLATRRLLSSRRGQL